MLKKNFAFYGNIFLELNENKFVIHPEFDPKLFSIYYDSSTIPTDNSLSMSIKPDKSSRSTCILRLMNQGKEILEISLQSPELALERMEEDCTYLKKTIKMMDSFNLKSNGGLVEVFYKYDTRTKHCVLTNPEGSLHDINRWLCDLWPPKCKCDDYLFSISGEVLPKSFTPKDHGHGGSITVEVAERCDLFPITKDGPAILVPWTKTVLIMRQRLSKILQVDIDSINLFDKQGQLLDGTLQLDIDNFRSDNSQEVPAIVYDLKGMKVRCRSMQKEHQMVEVEALTKQTVSDVKRKLAYFLDIEEERLILSRENFLMGSSEMVSIGEEVDYCVGRSCKDLVKINKIGSGAYGNVFQITDPSKNKECALKELKITEDEKADFRIRELLVFFSMMAHPNIVQYYDIYIQGDEIGLSMEYLQESLRDRLRKEGPLHEGDIKSVSRDLLQGLQYMHGVSIHHRDVKGSNVLFGENNIAKLCDFGMSKILSEYSRTQLSKGVLQTSARGSFRWMAPEVFLGAEYGVKTDIWSLGATVVEMITGKIPFDDYEDPLIVTCIADNKEIVYTPPTPLSVPLQEFVNSCLEPIPEKRLNASKLLELPFFQETIKKNELI